MAKAKSNIVELGIRVKADEYDRIVSGKQKEVYKQIKHYWCTRITGVSKICPYSLPTSIPGVNFCQIAGCDCVSKPLMTLERVCIRCGGDRKPIRFELKGIKAWYVEGQWEIFEGEKVFIIELGNIIQNKTKETRPQKS